MTSIMEAPAMLEDGNAPQSRRSTCLRVAFYALIFLLIVISALAPIVVCLLHHQQVPRSCWAHGSLKESPTQKSEYLSWNWKLEHCNGLVQDQEEFLIIQQSGNYFIYGQLYREETTKESLTLMLYKYPQTTLNKAVGPGNGTVNFARLFSLQEGDKLCCKQNNKEDHMLLENQTYWGLFKM